MTRLKGGRSAHFSGWTGPLIEDAEPDTVKGAGALDDGLNLMALAGRRRVVRGGSRVVTTFAAVSGSAINNTLGVFPYTPSGLVAVAHTSAGSKHYAYGLTDTGAFISGTESTSRATMVWDSATPGRPLGVELFEKFYVTDATEAVTRNGMSVAVWASSTWTVTQPTYDLDASGGSPGVLRGYCCEAFNGVLFVSGYDSESGSGSGSAPHLIRHSLLGTDPSVAGGFDYLAYLILGAKGQFVRAMKKGRTVMLVAKENELYAISGAGRSLPGWQYQVQQVNNTVGAGCTNPYALDHAMGMWYGLGRAGPWASDGGSVQLLRTGRDRSWGRADKLHLASVTVHAERRQVWFGFYETGRGSFAVAPMTYWVWDLEREQWDTSQRFARSFHMVGYVAQGATVAPSTSPGAPLQDTGYPFAADAIEGTFTLGDATAATEVWIRTTGSFTLAETVAAGVNRTRITGLDASTLYYLKIRHTKGGAFSDYSAEIAFYTRLGTPVVFAGSLSTTNTETVRSVRTFNQVPDCTLDVTTTVGSWTAQYLLEPAGFREDFDTSPIPVDETYSVTSTMATWPIGLTVSQAGTGYQMTVFGSSMPSKVGQDFRNGLSETSISTVFWPNRHASTYAIEHRLAGSVGAFTRTISYTTPALGNALSPVPLTITSLTHSTRYEVRMNNITSSSAGDAQSVPTVMFTKLRAPALVATSTGAGTPVVNLAVTIAASGVGVQTYNADKSHDVTHAGPYTAGVQNFASTGGASGRLDRYYARIFHTSWPTPFYYSDPAIDDVTDPGTVGS